MFTRAPNQTAQKQQLIRTRLAKFAAATLFYLTQLLGVELNENFKSKIINWALHWSNFGFFSC